MLQTGPDVQPEGKGKTVVAWEESLSGGVMTADLQGEKNKTVAVVSSVLALKSSVRPQPPRAKAPHPVSHIYVPEYLPDAAVLVGPAGQVSVADKELRVQHTFTPQNQQASTLLKHFLFPLLYLLLLVTACRSITSCCAITVPQEWRHFKGGNCRYIRRWKFELTRGVRTSHGRDSTCICLLTSQLT